MKDIDNYNNIYERWPEIIDAMKLLYPMYGEEKYIDGLGLLSTDRLSTGVSLTVLIPSWARSFEYEMKYKRNLISTIYTTVGLECNDIEFIPESYMDNLDIMIDRQQLLDEKVFDFVYCQAINDSTLQKAYFGKKKEIENNQDARNIIKRYVDHVMLYRRSKPDFIKTAENVSNAINDDEFTFGNIQKLINMTIKYFFVSSYDSRYDSREQFTDCHCPMDRIMMEKVTKDYLKYNGNNKDDPLVRIPLGYGRSSTDLNKTAWNKITFKDYDGPYSIRVYYNFQIMVKKLSEEKGLIPIEYDLIKRRE